MAHVYLYADSARPRTIKQSLEDLSRSDRILLERCVCSALPPVERHPNIGTSTEVVAPVAASRQHERAVWLFVATDRQRIRSAALTAGDG